jgi:hypothetical protein
MADSTKLSLIMGARNGALESREDNDYYATDPRALELFLEKFNEDGECLSENVWECACGEGFLSDVLLSHGHSVYSSDLVDRGYYGTDIKDFLNTNTYWNGDILTNPPYKYAKEFVLKALDSINNGHKVIFFLKCQFLEGQERLKTIYKNNPPKYVYVHSSRQNCAKNGDFEKYKSATLCYCWFVWQKGFKGETILRWID